MLGQMGILPEGTCGPKASPLQAARGNDELTDFYEALAAVYDDVFPLSPAQIKFVSDRLPPAPCRIIDLGCSTGALARVLAAAGYDVWGVDLSSQMIAQAEAAPPVDHSARVSFTVTDMRDAVTNCSDVGALLCLGNTLVHLHEPGDLAAFLAKCRRALRPGGTMIGQIVNYDRVQRQKVTQLPTLIGKQGNQLSRSYRERADGLLDFVTRLSMADGNALDSDVVLYPLQRSELQQLLAAADFAEVTFSGSYQGEEWSEETFHTIFTAKRAE